MPPRKPHEPTTPETAPRLAAELLQSLRTLGSAKGVASLARLGVTPSNVFGVAKPALRRLADKYKGDHELAMSLWNTGNHDARVLASLVDDPAKVTRQQMRMWSLAVDSWELCDQVMGNLFARTPWAYEVAKQWSRAKPEFVKRAGFVLMGELAQKDTQATDNAFLPFFPLILREAIDDRTYVHKSVNAALKDIGRRSAPLGERALVIANQLAEHATSPVARWVGAEARRELQAPARAKKKAV